MAVKFNNKNNICIKRGDPVELTVLSLGDVKAEVGDTAVFMVKESKDTPDIDALITKNINVSLDSQIPIYVPSSETKILITGEFVWSIKHTKQNGDTYVIIPDDCKEYPSFIIEEELIDG